MTESPEGLLMSSPLHCLVSLSITAETLLHKDRKLEMDAGFGGLLGNVWIFLLDCSPGRVRYEVVGNIFLSPLSFVTSSG